MNVNVTSRREEVELCKLKPGDVFMPSAYEIDGYFYMVVNTCSADGICLDFEEGDIVGVCLDDGEVVAWCPDTLVYVVKGEFKGEYLI